MFKNIGKKIQHLTVFCFVVAVIIVILAAIGVGFYLAQQDLIVGIAVGVIIGVLGFLLFWLGSFTSYAYGKIAECSEEQVRLLAKLLEAEGIEN